MQANPSERRKHTKIFLELEAELDRNPGLEII
jgi:hypothetical protein